LKVSFALSGFTGVRSLSPISPNRLAPIFLAARLLRYKVSWMSSFLFAVIVIVLVIFDHVLAFDQSVAIRFVHVVMLLLVLVILGSWFFSARGMNRSGTLLGWGGGIRLIALAFAMMVIVAFAIILPAQVVLSKHLSQSP
jgi:hypothetical protein